MPTKGWVLLTANALHAVELNEETHLFCGFIIRCVHWAG
jgi:hypothetical protein